MARNKRILKTTINIADSNGMWKGDDVGYTALHEWVAKRLPRPNLCVDCNKKPALDLANKGIYNRELRNWEWLCRSCHMIKDGRMDKLHQKVLKDIECKQCGITFSPESSKRKFCSTSCGLSHSNSLRIKDIKCCECGKIFTGYVAKKVCSTTCTKRRKAHLARRRYHREGR